MRATCQIQDDTINSVRSHLCDALLREAWCLWQRLSLLGHAEGGVGMVGYASSCVLLYDLILVAERWSISSSVCPSSYEFCKFIARQALVLETPALQSVGPIPFTAGHLQVVARSLQASQVKTSVLSIPE
ncbi:hypothetical protein BR93DRAFT_733501 [Coniochaeta sp. PMI_546]|nr:hypothetical protein BR93DRAFT_733501 [Coniochaeta sp. PMI_546]